MEEGNPEEVLGQVFHGRLLLRRDAVATEDLESGMTPVGKHGDQVFCNSPSSQEHLEDFFDPRKVLSLRSPFRSTKK